MFWQWLRDGRLCEIRYGRGQIERSPQTSRFHLQGYICTSSRKRVGTLNKLVHKSYPSSCIFFGRCKGTHGQNVSYVTKTDSRVASLDPIGEELTGEELSAGGGVGKIARLIELSRGPGGIKGAAEELPVTTLTNIRNLHTYLDIVTPPYRGVRFNWFFSGPSRSGKSRFCYALAENAYVKGAGKWFDGYFNEKVAIFDECQCLGQSAALILKITDRYPARVERKGSMTYFNACLNLFTSNLAYHEALVNDKESNDLFVAVKDRFALITDVIHIADAIDFPVVKLRDFIMRPSAPALISWKGASIAVARVESSSRFPVSDLLKCMVIADVFLDEHASSEDHLPED